MRGFETSPSFQCREDSKITATFQDLLFVSMLNMPRCDSRLIWQDGGIIWWELTHFLYLRYTCARFRSYMIVIFSVKVYSKGMTLLSCVAMINFAVAMFLVCAAFSLYFVTRSFLVASWHYPLLYIYFFLFFALGKFDRFFYSSKKFLFSFHGH